MRFFVGLALALGTLRLVGCGAEGPECMRHEDCDDQNACTQDQCVNFMCTFRRITCSDASECTVDSCDPDVGCQYSAVDDGIPCDEANECTDGQCVHGACEAEPLFDGTACDEGNQCTDGVCESGVCELTLLAHGTPCGQEGAGICQAGACAGPFPCTESGIRHAFVTGGGPLRFLCDGPTTIPTSSEIHVDTDVILDGEGNITLDGGGVHRVLNVQAKVTLDGFTITRGHISDGNGGGIANGGRLTLLNSTVCDSVARLTSRYLVRGFGGGIHNTGTLTLINSTVSGNAARGTWQPPTICWGGDCPDVFEGGDGGGIENRGTLFLSNTTVSENYAESTGGGIFHQGSLARLANSTIANNRGSYDIFGAVSLKATVVSGDRPCAYGIESDGYNIESDGDSCGFDQPTDQVNVSADDLKLGPLQDNGGPTETHALGAGSVAIDQVPAVDCVDADGEPLTTDQRGFPRDSMCDVGAFEVQP